MIKKLFRDGLLNTLREEQILHRKQLKQLQVALQSSLGHIRGLKVVFVIEKNLN